MPASPHEDPTPRGWTPATRIRAEVSPPASKSHALRVLLAAAVARGTSRIRGHLSGEDVDAALRVLADLGVACERSEPDLLVVHGRGPEGWAASPRLEAGESGTLARLLTALVAIAPSAGLAAEVHASGTLRTRPSEALFDALRRAGARLDEGGSPWPLRIRSARPPEFLRLERARSSQELSALLLACAARATRREVQWEGELPSRPYVDLTLDVLRAFGARTEERGGAFEVEGPLGAPTEEVRLEPDASAAAVALAAACLSGGTTRIEGFGASPRQGDARIVEHLEAFGCDARLEGGALRASGEPTRGAELDLRGEPDLAPVLTAVAGAAALRHGARSRLDGLETLNSKECRRLDVLAGALARLGLCVHADEALGRLEVGPGTAARGPLLLDPHSDHRMAFAFALLGLVRPDVSVKDPSCVAKSWPSFWEACTLSSYPSGPPASP